MFTYTNQNSLFDDLFNSLDVEDFLQRGIKGLKDIPRYPLTDIYTTKDNKLFIELAVAGFGPNDIDIEIEGDLLIISGEKEPTEEKRTYIQEMISSRKFERKIKLRDEFLAGDIEAEFKDGILKISITAKETPKKTIAIKYND